MKNDNKKTNPQRKSKIEKTERKKTTKRKQMNIEKNLTQTARKKIK